MEKGRVVHYERQNWRDDLRSNQIDASFFFQYLESIVDNADAELVISITNIIPWCNSNWRYNM